MGLRGLPGHPGDVAGPWGQPGWCGATSQPGTWQDPGRVTPPAPRAGGTTWFLRMVGCSGSPPRSWDQARCERAPPKREHGRRWGFSPLGCRDPGSGLSPGPDFTVPSAPRAAARWVRHTLFPSAAQVKPTDVSNYCPIWRLPGPANFWARQRRNNRSIVRLYITAPIPASPGTLPGPCLARNAAPAPQCRPPESAACARPEPRAAGCAHPEPCETPARHPRASPAPQPGDRAGSRGAQCQGGGLSPSSPPPAPPAAWRRRRPSRRSCWRITGSGGSS